MFIVHLFPFTTHSIIEIQRNVQPFPFILQQKTPLAELLQNFNEFFNRKAS
ncbi:pullulanase [Bacillus cereus]|uniref:Pullulanase n=1 Tax=Bacillus cereus TaxID=1396 RepID=A0A2A7I316_BACCE|nr:pullulanase [Bacillus cereus]PES95774.1 pullulanase [Bacillus cereus]PFP81524.1 pullulanase [Bacillus cereus]PGT16872.1 pullulanase [Bacillus cereus]PGZ09158.1 pullulanase [Bacillus cereus]